MATPGQLKTTEGLAMWSGTEWVMLRSTSAVEAADSPAKPRSISFAPPEPAVRHGIHATCQHPHKAALQSVPLSVC